MEDIDAKVNRLHGDVNRVVELYDYAENLLSYDDVWGPRDVTYPLSLPKILML